MKPLETQRKVLTKLCMCSSDTNESKREKVFRIVFSCTLFVIFSSFAVSSAVFIWKSGELEDQLYALFQICACLITIYPSIVMILLRYKIAAVLENLNESYDEHKDDVSFRFLARANNTCKWLWGIYVKYGIYGFDLVLVLNYIGLMVFFRYIDQTWNTEHFFQMLKLILPWDQQTLIGYIAEMFCSLSIFNTYAIIHGAIMLFFISLCLHHRAFHEMFRHSTRKWDTSDGESDHKGQFVKLLRLHISTKDFFIQTAEVFSHIIVIELIGSMIALAVSIFQIDLKFSHSDFNISLFLLVALTTIGNLFLYCYMGKIATDSFQGMSDCLYECNWHELPIDFQKYFILMIQNTQKPIHYHGFGVVLLNLETFCDFLRAVYTYYMIFKTLTSD